MKVNGTAVTTYIDGRIEQKPWDASRFSVSSNLFGNLRSRPEFRSGNWQAQGIVKVHVRVAKNAYKQINMDR